MVRWLLLFPRWKFWLQYFLFGYYSTDSITRYMDKKRGRGVYWRTMNQPMHLFSRFILDLLSICTGIFGTFYILQFEISSLMNWVFFLVWKQTGYFYQFKLGFFPSFWARVKYFDGPCLTIYSLFTIYRDIHYQLLVWWIHYTHCCEWKKWKPGKFQSEQTLWNDIFNYPNWDFRFC